MAEKTEIRHDPEAGKFFTVVDGRECRLEYQVEDDGTLDFCYTFVPPELRNRGIARTILVEASEYARRNSKKIHPTCSYAKSFFLKNRDYSGLVR